MFSLPGGSRTPGGKQRVLMTLNKEVLGHELKKVAQFKKCIEELDEKERAEVLKIKDCETMLIGIRKKKTYFEYKLIQYCDKLFNDVYAQLPD